MTQHRFRVRDSWRKAFLVQLEQKGEILRVVWADGNAHGPILGQSGRFREEFAPFNRESGMLSLSRPAAPSFYFFLGGACANRSHPPG